jgi:NAD(P)H-flavin reductase
VAERHAFDIEGPDPMAPVPHVVIDRWEETHDTFTIALRPEVVAPFRPGQFNMLYPLGIGESAISISGSPDDAEHLVHTIRRVGAVTEALGRLAPGDRVGVRGPFGSWWPIDELTGGDLVFVAGGIGMAPLRPAVYRLAAVRDRFDRVVLVVGARTPGDLLYAGEMREWGARFEMEVEVTVDAADDQWHGPVGVVTRLIPGLGLDPERTTGFVCGPEIMMRFAADDLMAQGIPASRIHMSMERNMECAVGFCGHCQFGPFFVCREGPVFSYDRVLRLMTVKEL